MSMDPRRFLDSQRKRVTGAVLGFCERSEWYGHLSDSERESLRQKVLDAVAAYHDACLDCVKALDDGSGVTNEMIWELLQQVHAGGVRSQRPFTAQVAGGGS